MRNAFFKYFAHYFLSVGCFFIVTICIFVMPRRARSGDSSNNLENRGIVSASNGGPRSERSNLESVDYKGTEHSNLVLRSSHHITDAVFFKIDSINKK